MIFKGFLISIITLVLFPGDFIEINFNSFDQGLQMLDVIVSHALFLFCLDPCSDITKRVENKGI